MSKLRIFIALSEFPLALELCLMLKEIGYPVPSESEMDEGKQNLEKGKVDVLILDIVVMNEIEGIALAAEIKQMHSFHIIFLNFLEQEAILRKAREMAGLSKLVSQNGERLVQHAMEFEIGPCRFEEKVEDSVQKVVSHEAPDGRAHIFLRNKDRLIRVKFDQVLWAVAQSNYVKVVTEKGAYVLAITLQKLHEHLNAANFIRVHRSFLVNVDKVESITHDMLYIESEAIPVSKNKREEVFNHFEVL